MASISVAELVLVRLYSADTEDVRVFLDMASHYAPGVSLALSAIPGLFLMRVPAGKEVESANGLRGMAIVKSASIIMEQPPPARER